MISPMRFGGIVVIAICVLLAPAVSLAQPAPPGSGGAMPWEPAPPTPLYLGRLEVDFELAKPVGELSDREVVDDARALRVGIGFNLSQFVSMTFGSRFFFITEDRIGRDFYYFDLLMLGLRINYDTGRRITLFAGGDLSLSGMSVPCNQPDPPTVCDSFDPDPNETAFEPRLGVHWRAGVLYQVQPGKFDVGVHLAGVQAIPDYLEDGAGWLTLGVGIVMHYGALHPSQRGPQTTAPAQRTPPAGKRYY